MRKFTEKMFNVLLVIIALIETENTVNGGVARQYFISTPANTTVNSGQKARLSCMVGNMIGGCHWTKDGLSLEGAPRFTVGGEGNSNCDLSIEPVLVEDEGQYQCVAGEGLRSKEVMLMVNSEPGVPYIVQARDTDRLKVERGEEIQLVCESQGGRPPAEIQWWDGSGRRIVSDVTEHVSRMGDGRNFKTTSTLRFAPAGEMKVKCSAHNDMFPAGKMSDYLKIKVKGQPTMEQRALQEGDSVKIYCNSEQTLGDLRFKWFINDVEIVGETKDHLEIEQFSKSYDKSKVKCASADNDEVLRVVELVFKEEEETREPRALPKTFKDLRKIVEDGAKNVKKAGVDVVDDGKEKTMFTCIMEEDVYADEPKYVWMNGQLKKVETVEATDSKGKYKCKVVPRGMKKMKKMSKDLKNFAKSIRKLSKTLNEFTSPIEE